MITASACSNPAGGSGGDPAAANMAADTAEVLDDSTTAAYLREVGSFMAGAGPLPAGLADGASSRDRLVEQFVTALEQQDTATLRRLVLTRAEFAHLYYPHTRFTRAPYRMAPELLWFLIQNNSSKGITRVYQRYAGTHLGEVGYTCGRVITEGVNRLWEECRLVLPGTSKAEVGERWFGSIIEHGGIYKFVSYANDL